MAVAVGIVARVTPETSAVALIDEEIWLVPLRVLTVASWVTLNV
jgi:hypothetical protein